MADYFPAPSSAADDRLTLQLAHPALAEPAGRETDEATGRLSVGDLPVSAKGQWRWVVARRLGQGQRLRGTEAELPAPGQDAPIVSVGLAPLHHVSPEPEGADRAA